MSQRWSTDSRVLLHSARIIVDASIELMRAESFSNESTQVNLSENSNGLETWKVEIETETSALETETFGRSGETRPWIGLETETSRLGPIPADVPLSNKQLYSYTQLRVRSAFMFCLLLIYSGGATSKAGGKAAGAAPPRLRLVPESDAVKLTSFLCGGNTSREGGADPELKPESEYPDWLWTLRTDRGSPSLDELDPNSWEYWRQLRTVNTKRRLSVLKDKFRYRRF